MGAAFAVILAWVAGRVLLLTRQSRHLVAHRGDDPPETHNHALACLGVARKAAWLEALLLAVLAGGGAAALAAYLPGPVLVTVLLLARDMLRETVAAWRALTVDARFGLCRQTKRHLAGDAVKRLALSGATVLAVSALLLPLLPDHWLAAWMIWSLAVVLRGWAWPALALPLFDRLEPLADAPLARRLSGLLERGGIGPCPVLVARTAHRSRRANASVAGFGGSRRIVVSDTLLALLDADEVEAVVAHEAGHCRHHHMLQYFAALTAAGLPVFAILPLLSAQPAVAVAVAALLAPAAGFWLLPLAAWARRRLEYQADAFAARHADGPALASALDKLYAANATPRAADPLYAAFTAFHPDPAERRRRLRRPGNSPSFRFPDVR